ncbi:ABC transporter ATP-binding protein [Nisaea acidiphila]|uniref:ABC transporter ATP-binding protein n=1 Tax=Nisaea acidiphila TaxID=1862145 RepID=A0A9J7AUB0_9PROT|nr:ABC transporter ATP-binding protein [Nisaea acidiphila]UUX49900.1 ABC transporter ATP-binding protein [Nisaea acidiphila]
MTGIAVKGLTKSWGATTAVEDVSFTVEPGTFSVLLGPSGCGKSTILRLISGLESASSGSIEIGGKDVTARPPAERDLAMVFQSYALFPHLSVAENILFGLKVRKATKQDQSARLARVADLLGLSGLLERRPSQLSGGQQQRVALGRAIIAEKPVCLMDEPLSNLDAKLRHEMRVEIRALQRKLGMTMVYVTHDQAEAMGMADRIILLKDGRIEQDASPLETYSRPATSFAGRFIGTPPMNILALSWESGGVRIRDTGPALLNGLPQQDLALGVRPEDIAIDSAGPHRAEVESIEYLGADTLVDCRIGSERLTVRARNAEGIGPGSGIGLSWPRTAIHLFDAATGMRRDDLLIGAEG